MNDILRNEELGEAAYDAMYDARYPMSPKLHFEDACVFFSRAIAEAERLDMPAEVLRLTQRIDHVRAVYNSQFRYVVR